MNDWLTLDEAAALVGRDEAEVYIAMRHDLVLAERQPDGTGWRVDPWSLLAWACRTPPVDWSACAPSDADTTGRGGSAVETLTIAIATYGDSGDMQSSHSPSGLWLGSAAPIGASRVTATG